ncbi:myelin-oligodendrocyte glycoprotein-like [Girardinichthys multiradiatus]|uniref:myelin-oligodendrocyte glycoprotein-like n=1 Tax=Girardinichthys multiradiatus TaxID=208333 RepID=UPI001FAE4728|nr:myelin-oligodendrocyte glycoprotein-like [Girardinichthys multiradiatus]
MKAKKMAAWSSADLWWILFSVSFFFTSTDQTNITAEPGQNTILPCRAADNKPVIAVEWRRTDLGKEYVLLYRDGRIDPGNQHPSYKNRVDLQDRQMMEGNVSLVLKNLTTNDTGAYECRVQNEGSRETKLINLDVSPPGSKDGGSKDGSIGLIVGLITFAAVVAAGVLFVMYRRKSACFREKTPDPPADL